MKDIIQQKLIEIEESQDVKILYAVESGSRAWGFHSPDSDYDVRFIYARPLSWYLRLNNTRDVIEYELNEVLDISGWDFDKTLKLFHSSNSTLYEWLISPIVYKTTDKFEELRPIFEKYYRQKNGIHHYVGTAQSNYDIIKEKPNVKLKKYFYVIRPLLACKWILNKKTPPPVLFDDLVESQMNAELMDEMSKLLVWKKESNESDLKPRLSVWDSWIEDTLNVVKSEVEGIETAPKPNWDELNDVFYRAITE